MSVSSSKLTVDYKLFVPSVIIIVALCIPLALYEQQALTLMNSIFEGLVGNLGWMYIWYPILITLCALYFSFSRYGNVVLGDPSTKPRFSNFQYLAIIISMGIGSTIMRTAVVQWASVASDPPFGLTPFSDEALMWGNSFSMYLWGFQNFALFAMTAPAMGYVLYVRKKPLMRVSEITRCVFGDRFTDGLGGRILDITFLIAIVAGSATFLGLGTPMVTTVVAKLLDIERNFQLSFIVTLSWCMLFMFTVYLGMEKGIQKLSTFNMYLAAVFGILVLILGPTVFIMNYFTDTIGFLFSNYLTLSFQTESLTDGAATHIYRYSVFWWAYVATWSLLHGVFAAKISEGRTVREVLMAYILASPALAWVATGLMGGLGVSRYLNGEVPLMEIMQSGGGEVVAAAEVIASLPFAGIMLVVFGLLTMVFFGTTLNSTTFAIAAYASTRDMTKEDPDRTSRIIWAVLIAVLALVLMRVGGLVPLEVTSGLLGFPIMFVQFITVYAAKKMMDEDRAWIHNIRPIEWKTGTTETLPASQSS